MVDISFCVKLKQVEDIDEVERKFIERVPYLGYEVEFLSPLPTSRNKESLEKYDIYMTSLWLRHKEFSEAVPFDMYYVSQDENKRMIRMVVLSPILSNLASDVIIYQYDVDRFLEYLKQLFNGQKASYEVEGYGGCADDLLY